MNYLQAFPEWNFYTRPDCEQEPSKDLRLSDLGENYKTGETCLVMTTRRPVDPMEDLPLSLDVCISAGIPLVGTVVSESCRSPVGTRELWWLEASNPAHGAEYAHHDNPDHWGCVVAWRPLNKP